MAAIETHELTKVYRSQKKQPGLWAAVRDLIAPDPSFCLALDRVTFAAQGGELVGVLGPNGAGKTTFLKLLSGLLYPTAGSAEVLGQVPWRREASFKKKIALVMGQKNQLWWDLPAMDTFLWLKEVYEIPTPAFKRTVDELVSVLEARDELHVQVRRLSLGQRMKMELVAALLHAPGVLFLDEPTLGLDIVAQGRIRAFLKEHNRECGTTILLTSHQMVDIEDMCRRVVILAGGRVTYDGGLDELVREHCDYKLVSVLLAAGRLDERALGEGVAVVEAAGDRYLLRVPRARAQALASLLWSRYDVADLDLREPAATEVIERLFSQQAREPARRPAGEG